MRPLCKYEAVKSISGKVMSIKKRTKWLGHQLLPQMKAYRQLSENSAKGASNAPDPSCLSPPRLAPPSPPPLPMAQHTPEFRGSMRPCTKHQRPQHMNGHRVTENMNHLLTIVPDQWIIVSKQRLGDIPNKPAWDQSVISCIERWISCQDECLNRCWLASVRAAGSS